MKKIIFLLLLFSVTVSKSSAQLWKDAGNTYSSSWPGWISYIYYDSLSDNLIAGGHFDSLGTADANLIASWDGISWSPIGQGFPVLNNWSDIQSITRYNGELYAYYDHQNQHKIYKWDGSTWILFATANSYVKCLKTFNNKLYVGGGFTVIGGHPINGIAIWDGLNWSTLGGGVNGMVYDIEFADTVIYVGGYFPQVGGSIQARNVAKWNGTNWETLGTGITGDGGQFYDGYIFTLKFYNNDLYAGGNFDSAGGVFCYEIAKWNGVNWAPLSESINDTSFHSVGYFSLTGPVTDIFLYNGKMVFAGWFTNSDTNYIGSVAYWDGINWSMIGNGLDYSNPSQLCEYHNELYVSGGGFTSTCCPADTFRIIARFAQLNLQLTNSTCATNCDGTATVTDSVGVSPHIYLWSDGQTTRTAIGLCPGVYGVSVTDGGGSVTEASVTIDAPPAIQLIPTITDASCGVCADGSINLSVTGGTGSYNLLWNTSDTTNAITNLAYGNYAVTVTDSVSCSITDTFQVSYSNSIQTQSTVINCYGECTGTASVSVNGIPPFTFQWNNSDTTAAISNLCAGTYIITVTDSNGVVASDTVVINELSQINFQDTTSNATCPTCADGMATTTISGGTQPYHYNWSNGATTNSIDSLAAGTYYVTVTDDNNCVAVDTVTVGFDVGVNEQLSVNSNQLTVTPLNENSMAITISATINTKAQLIIYNTQGQLIGSKNIVLHQGTNHFTEPTPTAQGMYLLQLQTAGEVRNVKFIRE